jgi:hypothetical protein
MWSLSDLSFCKVDKNKQKKLDNFFPLKKLRIFENIGEMQLTLPLNIVNNPSYFYRIWGYWKSPYMMKILGLDSDRQRQRLNTRLMVERGKGKSRRATIYEVLNKPKYKTKWVRALDESK